MHPKTEHSEPEMVAEASALIGKLLKRECAGWGDQSSAIERIARRAGVSQWTIDRIRKGRAKSVRGRVKQALRLAYIDVCEEQIRQLQHEVMTEKAKGGGAVYLDDLEDEIAALAAKVLRAKEASRVRRD